MIDCFGNERGHVRADYEEEEESYSIDWRFEPIVPIKLVQWLPEQIVDFEDSHAQTKVVREGRIFRNNGQLG
mgnify:CR=1 FL=1